MAERTILTPRAARPLRKRRQIAHGSRLKLLLWGLLTFDAESINIPIQYVITNTGGSPANNVLVKAQIIFSPYGIDAPLNQDALTRQKQLCARPYPFAGYTIFPNQPLKSGWQFTTNRDELEAAIEFQPPEGETIDSVTPQLIGCVSYTFR